MDARATLLKRKADKLFAEAEAKVKAETERKATARAKLTEFLQWRKDDAILAEYNGYLVGQVAYLEDTARVRIRLAYHGLQVQAETEYCVRNPWPGVAGEEWFWGDWVGGQSAQPLSYPKRCASHLHQALTDTYERQNDAEITMREQRIREIGEAMRACTDTSSVDAIERQALRAGRGDAKNQPMNRYEKERIAAIAANVTEQIAANIERDELSRTHINLVKAQTFESERILAQVTEAYPSETLYRVQYGPGENLQSCWAESAEPDQDGWYKVLTFRGGLYAGSVRRYMPSIVSITAHYFDHCKGTPVRGQVVVAAEGLAPLRHDVGLGLDLARRWVVCTELETGEAIARLEVSCG